MSPQCYHLVAVYLCYLVTNCPNRNHLIPLTCPINLSQPQKYQSWVSGPFKRKVLINLVTWNIESKSEREMFSKLIVGIQGCVFTCVMILRSVRWRFKSKSNLVFPTERIRVGWRDVSIDLFLNASYLFSSHYQSIDQLLIIDTHDTISTFPMFMHQ